jgi:hypothetical protein
VASGDFRLKKLIPPLEKSGEKAPVFAKVAQAVKAVVESTEKTASAALLELATLVNAILYTQGETGIAGELKPLETTELGGEATQASARVLKPSMEALSTTGSGRLEVIRDAHERGAFKDLRLVRPALNAIDDPYPEIAEFVVEKVLPMYGRAIVPELRAKLEIKGRGGHVQRLRLLHKLDPEGSRDVVQQALNEGSKEMKVAAVECLGTTGEDLTYLLEQAKAKAKDVRAAALRALAKAEKAGADIVAVLKKAIAGGDLEMIITRIKRCELAQIRDFVIDEAEKCLASLIRSRERKEQSESALRLQQLLLCMEGWTGPRAEAFVLGCFEKAKTLGMIKSQPSGEDVNEVVAIVMSHGSEKMRRTLVAKHAEVSTGILPAAIFAARATMSPAEFYEQFSPMLKETSGKRTRKRGGARERADVLVETLESDAPPIHGWRFAGIEDLREQGGQSPLKELDPRWLDAAVEAGVVDLVCQLARPGHEGVIQFLAEKLSETKDLYDGMEVLRTMVKIGHPQAGDRLLAELKKRAKDTTHYGLAYWFGPMIADLPRSEAPKFEEALVGLPEKMVDQLMESVLALKSKPE